MQEGAWSSLSLTTSRQRTHCVRPRGFAAVVTCCLPRFPTMSLLPLCFAGERNTGSWRAAKGLQSFREALPACCAPQQRARGLGGDGALCFGHAGPALGCPFLWVSASPQWGNFRASWVLAVCTEVPYLAVSTVTTTDWEAGGFGYHSVGLLCSPLMAKHRNNSVPFYIKKL